MKKYLLTMVLMPLFCASAATETVDGITWTYLPMVDGTARIDAGSPYVRVIDISTKGAISIPATLGGRPVTSIGCSVFYGCSELTVVSIPSSVTRIENSAFEGCSGLTSFVVDSANPSYCSINGVLCTKDGLKLVAGVNGDVTIPSGVTSIGSYAFSGCKGLTSVDIPSSVTSIGYETFYKCSGLKSVIIPSGVTSIGDSAFYGCSGLDVVKVMYGDHGDIDSVKGLYNWPSRIEFFGMLPDPIFVPESGAVFDSSLKVSITNAVAGAAIYYTMDGTDPTTDSTPYKKFLLDHKATIKAIAAYKGVTSGVVTAHYAKGKVEDPVITADADLFDHSGNVIGISCPTPNAVIHYTTDGSVPTAESPVYERPFAIDDTTTVRAIAAEHPDYFDSEIVTRTFVRKWEVVKTPVLQSYYGSVQSGTPTTELRGSYLSVVMSCETEGAVIHFTTNGTVPTAESPVYEEPFKAFDTMTIRAIAVKDDWKDSSVTEIHVTKFWTIGDSLNLPDQGFAMGGVGDWTTDRDVSHDGVASMRSEEVSHNQKTSLNTEFTGSGRLSFWWKSSAEDWDGGQLFVDGVSRAEIFGETDWKNVVIDITGNTTHVISWVYAKDETESGGSDCIWLDQIVWASMKPTIDDDPKATVTGDAESGFVIKPSDGKTAVEVTIPQGVDAAKVTVEVSPKVASVKPNGAKVKVVVGENDITDCLVIPESDGVMNIAAVTVKEEIVKETLDPSKDAVIELNAANPRLTTAPTRKGLTYTLFEGHKLESLSKGDSKLGDGNSWTPTITVLGGDTAFYSIDVTK